MHFHRIVNTGDLPKNKRYYESYVHIALVCFVCLSTKHKDSRNLLTFVWRIQGFKDQDLLSFEHLNSSSYPDI
jgi:hypothetical protein